MAFTLLHRPFIFEKLEQDEAEGRRCPSAALKRHETTCLFQCADTCGDSGVAIIEKRRLIRHFLKIPRFEQNRDSSYFLHFRIGRYGVGGDRG